MAVGRASVRRNGGWPGAGDAVRAMMSETVEYWATIPCLVKFKVWKEMMKT